MSKVGVGQLFLLAIVTFCSIYVYTATQPTMKVSSLYVTSDVEFNASIRIALLSDLHVQKSPAALADLEELWSEVVKKKPDIILLAGDYIDDGNSNEDFISIGSAVANVLRHSNNIPVVAVLGNHDHWSGADAWTRYLSEAGVIVLENEIFILEVIGACIRGFGDAFTDHFRYVDFPPVCDGMLKISLMHDPAGAFSQQVTGLVLAGHTHCGQISIPFLGALYVPTQAPKEALCGLYKDEQRQVFVSSGVGTSVIPFRLNTQSEWDLITINY
ncbi:metallophosphoesterase [Porticoccaceae bacterium]|nr:metallophosphoesterase [Porticoccaceae bacterium]